jgi:hypothetical protein
MNFIKFAGLTALVAGSFVVGCSSDDTSSDTPAAAGAAGSAQAGTGGSGGTAAGAGGMAAGAGGDTAGGAGGDTAGGAGGLAGAGGSVAGAGGDTAGGAGGSAAGAGGAGAGGSAAGAGGAGGGSGAARIRFAHLAPDVAAVDFCFRPAGAADWSPDHAFGPFFEESGDPNSFYFPGISIYTDINAGSWEFRLVEAGSLDCLTSFTDSLADQTGTIVGGQSYTLTLEGELATKLQVKAYPDQYPASSGQVSYQVFNALTATGPIDFGMTDTSDPQNALFSTIVAKVQPLGPDLEAQAAPTADATPTAIKSGSSPAVVTGFAPHVVTEAGDQYSVFVVGTSNADETVSLRPSLIFCRNDNTNAIDQTNINKGQLIATRSCCYGDGLQDCNAP